MRIPVVAAATLAVSLGLASPAFARDHGTTPGLEGPALGKATNPPQSRMSSPGVGNPTTAPVAPIGPDGPVPDAPGANGIAPGQQALECLDIAVTPEDLLACTLP